MEEAAVMKRMMAFGVAAVFGTALGASAGPECCPEKAAAAKRKAAFEKADAALAAMKAVPGQVEKMTEADKAALAGAQAVLSKSCPVCKVMPETMGFLGESLAACAAIDKKSCDGDACEGGAKAAAAASRAKVNAKASELFGAMCAAMKAASGKSDCETACENAEKPACEKGKAGEASAGCPLARFDALIERADAVSATWKGVAGEFAALTPEQRAPLMAAMETMKKSNPGCAAWPGAVTALKGLLEAAAAQDAACAKACEGKAAGEAKAGDGCGPFLKRAALTKKVLDVVTQMAAVTAPKDAGCEKEKAAVTQ
jgi:hypothetical protein